MALAQAEKLGNIKLDGGGISGLPVTFEPGSLLIGKGFWFTSASLQYVAPLSMGPYDAYFSDAVGTPEVRGFGVHFIGVHARYVVVEVLLDSEGSDGTRLQVRTPDGSGPTQVVPNGRDQSALFVVEPNASNHEAGLFVKVLSTHRCDIRQITVRPVG